MPTATLVSQRVCALAELLPDLCSSVLHEHHITPISAGGDPDGPTAWVCERHHPMLESLARRVLKAPRRCTHVHPYPGGKEACERRLARLNKNA
jgi:hypothetical protein